MGYVLYLLENPFLSIQTDYQIPVIKRIIKEHSVPVELKVIPKDSSLDLGDLFNIIPYGTFAIMSLDAEDKILNKRKIGKDDVKIFGLKELSYMYVYRHKTTYIPLLNSIPIYEGYRQEHKLTGEAHEQNFINWFKSLDLIKRRLD